MTEIVKIPEERVKVLIGEGGKTKMEIEQKCRVELTVDSDGDVEVDGETTQEFFAKDVVKAIGRGFPSKPALRLADGDYNLYIIPLKDFSDSDKAISRMKGRVIGEHGKIKEDIENATESYLSIYGNTISIISKIDTLEYAKEAIGMILTGAPHTTVLNYLAKARREIRETRLRS